MKYLVQQKKFTAEHNNWEREENLENAKKLVEEFERKMKAEVRRQERIDWEEKKDFRRGELPEKYTAKMLYKQDDGKFKNEYLKKLKRNWRNWKGKDMMVERKDEPISSFRSRNFEGRVMLEI